MPIAIVFELDSDEKIPYLHFGKQTQGWFFNKLLKAAPKYAEAMHIQNEKKPLTCSDLWRKNGGYFFRVTAFEAELEDIIENEILPHIEHFLQLGWNKFQVTRIHVDSKKNAFANKQSYSHICETCWENRSRTTRLNMRFVSPTAFSENGNDILLPEPNRVFYSLFEQWNRYAPKQSLIKIRGFEPQNLDFIIDQRWMDFALKSLRIHDFSSLNTKRVEFSYGDKGVYTGFLGTVNYSILNRNKIQRFHQFVSHWQKNEFLEYLYQGFLKHNQNEEIATWQLGITIAQILAKFAYYSGVGHHTTTGMGQTHLVNQ